jgi:hypothetical protein
MSISVVNSRHEAYIIPRLITCVSTLVIKNDKGVTLMDLMEAILSYWNRPDYLHQFRIAVSSWISWLEGKFGTLYLGDYEYLSGLRFTYTV